MVKINPFVEAYIYQSKGDVLIYLDGVSQGVMPISSFNVSFNKNDSIENQIRSRLSEIHNTSNVYVIVYP